MNNKLYLEKIGKTFIISEEVVRKERIFTTTDFFKILELTKNNVENESLAYKKEITPEFVYAFHGAFNKTVNKKRLDEILETCDARLVPHLYYKLVTDKNSKFDRIDIAYNSNLNPEGKQNWNLWLHNIQSTDKTMHMCMWSSADFFIEEKKIGDLIENEWDILTQEKMEKLKNIAHTQNKEFHSSEGIEKYPILLEKYDTQTPKEIVNNSKVSLLSLFFSSLVLGTVTKTLLKNSDQLHLK